MERPLIRVQLSLGVFIYQRCLKDRNLLLNQMIVALGLHN